MTVSFAGQNPRVNTMRSLMQEIADDPKFSTYSPDVQQMMLFGGVLGSQPSQIPSEEELERMGSFQERQARRAQELGKESIGEAFKYSMLSNIPKQIAAGFGNQAALTVLGARSAVDAMNETMRARTPLSFASAPYQVQKYFS
jgi:hypothetical protein